MTAKLLLILRFYRSAMLFCGAASLALAWVAKVHGTPIVPALLLGKALIYRFSSTCGSSRAIPMNSTITATSASAAEHCWA